MDVNDLSMIEEIQSSEEESTSERYDPSGESNDGEEISSSKVKHKCCEHSHCTYSSKKFEEKLRNLEEEHELLNSSLCALTTHFAQVQFRLRQAVAAPQADKESLLKSLEEFAFRGVPDVGVVRERLDEAKLTEAIWLRRVQQQQLIEKLKSEMRELERMSKSVEIGDLRDKELENQRIILNELKLRINLKLDEHKYYLLTPTDVREEVNIALEQLETPIKMKEELVAQLKIQVADLERFINYLQENSKNYTTCTCCTLQSVQKPLKATNTIGIVKRSVTLLHMFAIVYLGCNPQQYNKKKSNHWGDLRAELEMAIAKVLEAVEASEKNKPLQQGDYNSDNESSSFVSNVQVTRAVRKHLATSIRDLMQHGACKEAPIYKLVPFIQCFKQKFKVSDTPIHAWEIILKYYHLKSGERFNSTPVRKLSQSFNLDIASNKSNKHTMLSEIGNIISTHSTYKSSHDSHFKAFICAGLNSNKLVTWLRLIFQCRTLLKMHYHSWSYVVNTGFSDSLQSLDALTNLKFDLPVDLAVSRFQNIRDVFI